MKKDEFYTGVWGLFLAMIFFGLGGCGKNIQQSSDKETESFSVMNNNLSSSLQEAKYDDIPVPLGFEPVNRSMMKASDVEGKSSTLMMCYQGEGTIDFVIDFYRRNMDRYGWKIDDLSSEEGLLACRKKDRSCAVSIRPSMGRCRKKNTSIVMFLRQELKNDADVSHDINKKGDGELVT